MKCIDKDCSFTYGSMGELDVELDTLEAEEGYLGYDEAEINVQVNIVLTCPECGETLYRLEGENATSVQLREAN